MKDQSINESWFSNVDSIKQNLVDHKNFVKNLQSDIDSILKRKKNLKTSFRSNSLMIGGRNSNRMERGIFKYK